MKNAKRKSNQKLPRFSIEQLKQIAEEIGGLRRPAREIYVLDTSAVLALFGDEKGADRVEEIFERAQKNEVQIFISFMTSMETYYKAWQAGGEEAAKRAYAHLKSFPLEQVGVDESLILSAGALKAQYKLSVADAWVIATAIEKGAILLHKDPELRQVKEIVEMLEL